MSLLEGITKAREASKEGKGHKSLNHVRGSHGLPEQEPLRGINISPKAPLLPSVWLQKATLSL